MSSRERFEAWALRDKAARAECFERNSLGEYVYYKQTGLAWAAWLAARAEALEEVAEAWAVANAQLGCPVGTGLEDGCASCNFALLMRDAIKALKEEPA